MTEDIRCCRLPKNLNNCFVFSKYKQGTFFKPRYDRIFQKQRRECSVFTVTVYLNDNFKGGQLVFRRSKVSLGFERIALCVILICDDNRRTDISWEDLCQRQEQL